MREVFEMALARRGMLVRIEPELVEALKAEGARRGVTLNRLCVALLREGLEVCRTLEPVPLIGLAATPSTLSSPDEQRIRLASQSIAPRVSRGALVGPVSASGEPLNERKPYQKKASKAKA